MGFGRVQSLREESAPIIRCNLLQRFDNVIEGIRLDDRLAVIAAKESAAKVLQTFLSLSLLADNTVGFEPEEDTFVVIIAAAPPSMPREDRVDLRSQSCVA